jgi:hypothetical protein
MATYVNDLRLKEITTGDESGTWGTSTNTNLELIGEALSYGTQDCFSSDANATTTVADGATDPARAMYFKVTSSATLSATRTLTIAPDTVSRVMFIENATTGSQSIAISQGSGANVTIATGKTKVVYLDGAGGGAAVVDAFAALEGFVKESTSVSFTQVDVTARGDLRLQDTTGGEYIGFDAPATVSSSVTYTLPEDGSSGQVLSTNGSGTLSWTSVNTPGSTGTFTQVDITAQGDLRLQDTTGGQYVALQAPGTVASSFTLTLPADDGDADQFLQTNGSGTLDWATVTQVYSTWSVINTATNLVAGGQYVSNSGSGLTHTLPAGSANDTITLSNAGSGTVTVGRTSSQKIDSAAEDGTLNSGASVQLVYVDDTIGWHSL